MSYLTATLDDDTIDKFNFEVQNLGFYWQRVNQSLQILVDNTNSKPSVVANHYFKDTGAVQQFNETAVFVAINIENIFSSPLYQWIGFFLPFCWQKRCGFNTEKFSAS